MDTTILLLCGLPGSGKSTFAKEISKRMNKVKIISRDEIRFSILKEGEKYFAHEKEVFNTFINEINKAYNSGLYEIIIVDATHLTYKSREKVLNKIERLSKFHTIAVFFETPYEKCVKRNNNRTGLYKVPSETLHNMYLSLELPNPYKEKFNSVYYFPSGKVVEINEKYTTKYR